MKKITKIFIALLSITVLAGAAVPVEAASADVNIEIEATTMEDVSVTVPTQLPMVFRADGTNTLPTNWKIENCSTIAGIHLSQVEMNAGSTGWKLLAAEKDTKKLSADTKALQFSLGKEGAFKLVAPTNGTESATGQVTFEPTEISIPSGEEQILNFDVKRGAFRTDEASAKAFDMILTFEFN